MILPPPEATRTALRCPYTTLFRSRSGKIFDCYLIHSRFAGAAPLDGDFMTSMQSIAKGEPLKPVHIRSDIEAPVLTIITETDLASPLVGYVRARKPDKIGRASGRDRVCQYV